MTCACTLLACAPPVRNAQQEISGWTSVTVGVADLDEALGLWVDTFGFDVVARHDGDDPDLARLWDLAPHEVNRQALVRTRNSRLGMVHLVQFNDPAQPVRKGAEVYDMVPKNLDVYVDDMPRRYGELKAAGATFRTDSYSEITAPDGTAFREIHMPSHDHINVVLLEVVGKSRPFTSRGYGGVGPLIFIVPDAPAEKSFFDQVMRLEKLNDNLFKGPDIERMIGLPPGSGLDVSIWGRAGNDFGDIEIIQYQGVRGNNLYPQAKPKALGVLHISYTVNDASDLLERVRAAGMGVEDHGYIESLTGSGDVYSFATPAGLRIEVYDNAKTSH